MRKIKDLVIGDHLYYSYLDWATQKTIPLCEFAIGDFEVTNVTIVTREERYYNDGPYDTEEYWVDCYYKIFTVIPVDDMGRKILEKLYNENKTRLFPRDDIQDYCLTMKIDCSSDGDYTDGRGTDFPFYTTKKAALEKLLSFVRQQEELVTEYKKNLEENQKRLEKVISLL